MRLTQKVENEIHLVRDIPTKTILNMDKDGYRDYITQRVALRQNRDRLVRQEEQIKALCEEVTVLKESLEKLIQSINSRT